MEKECLFLIHYGELSLKGKNRKEFVSQLKRNITEKLLSDGCRCKIFDRHGFLLLSGSGKNKKTMEKNLLETFGISWFASVEKFFQPTMDAIYAQALLAAKKEQSKEKTFCVRVRRVDKLFSKKSTEVERGVGAKIAETRQWKGVRLVRPDVTVYIDIYEKEFFIYTDKIRGPQGMPVGTAGRLVVLLSGGIDSPVAAYLAAKRGCHLDFLHLTANAMQWNEAKEYKIAKIASVLSRYTIYSKLYLSPYIHFQMKVLDKNFSHELILFRRFIVRLGEKIAQDTGALAIVSGDNLAQVASQTLSNLVATSQAVKMPVFRPLFGFDKEEIVAVAKRIGTYELSILPYIDCCSLVEKRPKTKSRDADLKKDEDKIFQNKGNIIAMTRKDSCALVFKNGKLSK